jgi:protein-S-isoprenylcysteine O-methyltransferase Ste14
LVLCGGGISIFHYLGLKQLNKDISCPECLEQYFGLYKLVRHPMYFGDFIAYIGLFLLFPNVFSALILIIGLIALVKQSSVEDSFLEKQFPNEFKAWKGKTKLIFPYIF